MAKKKIKTNTSKSFIDGAIALNTEVFDPALERCKTVNDLEVLEAKFEEWLETTPEFWYDHIPPFERWVDGVWDWFADMDNQVIAGDEGDEAA